MQVHHGHENTVAVINVTLKLQGFLHLFSALTSEELFPSSLVFPLTCDVQYFGPISTSPNAVQKRKVCRGRDLSTFVRGSVSGAFVTDNLHGVPRTVGVALYETLFRCFVIIYFFLSGLEASASPICV